ncbi:MAG: hypothetical protein ACLFR0_07970 [Alphaproteobacteria bacterium]
MTTYKKKDLVEKKEEVLEVSNHIQSQLETLEKFIARRFDEISMEINATSQQVDMAEEGITRKFGEIMEVIQAITHKGGGMSPANAGVELDAVVDMTEDAANRILDAAGRIAALTAQDINWDNEKSRAPALESINKDVEEIFLACSFQDITSQRIKKTLENLKSIEERLGGVLDKLGIKLVGDPADNSFLQENKISSQDEIDTLFKNKKDSR